MKKISIEGLIIALFLILSLVWFGWLNMTRPTILILHSYAPDYSWVKDINIGLNRVLNSKYQYQVRWYYMDTKRHPFPDYKKSAGIAARHVIEKMKPDVIIAIDDDAQEYVTKYFVNDPKIRIVFSGVNNNAKDYGFDKANNVTGLLERLPLPAIRDALQVADNFKSLGRPVRLSFIGDYSAPANGDIKQVENFDWGPVQFLGVTKAHTFLEWQEAIKKMGTNSDVIMLTHYRQLTRPVAGKTVDKTKDKTLVSAKEAVTWTETNSKVPVFSANGFYSEEGGMLAIGTSPYEQGEIPAKMALKIILDGVPPNKIPIVSSTQFIVTMSEAKMKARGFELPKVYEAAARTGNKFFP